jgi:hypothetical protein
MISLQAVKLEQVIVHQVGNPSRGEALVLSEQPLTLNDELVNGLLTRYFLSSFNEAEQFHFCHDTDLTLNEVYHYVSAIFEDKKQFHAQSIKLAQLLYGKSTHSKVKEGELYVVQFDNLPLGDGHHRAIGIFKSETKETYLKVFPHGKSLEVIQESGIDINRLDKGCIVWNTQAADGYVVCVVDQTNKQDARYWVQDFLQVEAYTNEYHHTQRSLEMCKLYIDNAYANQFEVGKGEQVELMHRSIEYFKTKDHFELDEFTTEVMHHPEVVNSFMDFKQQYERSRNWVLDAEFDIHPTAVKKQERGFKSVIKLDKNFHLYIHGRRDWVEKGVDDQTGKKYYKLYYEEEH